VADLADLGNRWATEDPNPGEKIAEDKRVQEEGQKAIAGMLDEGLVEAAQTLRALEDGDVEDFYPIEASRPSPEPEERPAKRIRNGGVSDAVPNSGKRTAMSAGSVGDGIAGGLLSADAIDNLKFYAEMARKQAEDEKAKKAALAKPTMVSLLGGYGSGNESE
jgi:hypothetical protein